MIDRAALLRDLKTELAALEADVRSRTDDVAEYDADLRSEYQRAFELKRTAATYAEWRDRQVTQSAVAWLLGCVFVRFCEDNRLVAPVWLSGPPQRRDEAVDAHTAYFHAHPERNDRDWLLEAFAHLGQLPATSAIFDAHNPLRRLQPSADAAERLVRFWRRTDGEGGLVNDFRDEQLDTRFLGDLYQDLSSVARDQYALLQTPEFVEEFILDRTLERAIEERGIEGLKLIDPACGSGHFLLGAFARLLERWHRQAPGMDARERVQTVLDSIYGVDLNPFSIAIARFRLSAAALVAGGDTSLERAPGYRYHLAVGDSLLHGRRQLTLDLGQGTDPDETLSGFTYAAEDLNELREILQPDRYDVVVSNPPYITMKDRALNNVYRRRYSTCAGQYALTVPFTERLFQLASRGGNNGPSGWIGMIASNSFMKREFGAKLIESLLARIDLQLVADTAGAYIPGHGTPTVILVARNQPVVGRTVRAVLGRRGEPERPTDPACGRVWKSIIDHHDSPGFSNEWVTITDLDRRLLDKSPWSLAGGGAVDLLQCITSTHRRLDSQIELIGRTCHTGSDDSYFGPPGTWLRLGVASRSIVPVVVGECVRDWHLVLPVEALFPYDQSLHANLGDAAAGKLLWLHRTSLSERREPGGTHAEIGLTWFEYSRFHPDRFTHGCGIGFPFVATHPQFVLDRGGKMFNRTAPAIELPSLASEDAHLRLLGLLNSSTACFWLKQVCHDKGSQGINEGLKSQAWERFYEFTGTKLEQFPVPRDPPLEPAKQLDALAQQFSATTPAVVCATGTPSRGALDAARNRWGNIRARLIALQEELDWQVYGLYDLVEPANQLTYRGDDLPQLALGERAFEIVLARRIANGDEDTAWFERHGSTPITDLPDHWPAAYRDLVQRRIDLIAQRPDIALIERPECKRRWKAVPWEELEREALKSWLLNRLERPELWRDRQDRPQARSASQLADDLARDQDFLDVLSLLTSSRDYDLAAEVGRLLDSEAAPFVAAFRYSTSGLAKRAAWEEVWDLQRREDAGEAVGRIPVPPKYVQADFARQSYWHHRGKLDVPKERFIAYPGAERENDGSPVYGWAGWDHLEQALALASLVLTRRQQDGWSGDRLTPLLAGLVELEPWLHQWHAAPDPTRFPTPPATFLSTLLDQQLAEHRLTREDVARWRPAARHRGGRPRRTPNATHEELPL